MRAVAAEPISPEGVRCFYCGRDGPWVDPHKNMGLCKRHYEWRIDQAKAEDRAFVKRVLTYGSATKDPSAKKYADLIAENWRAFDRGDYAHLRRSPEVERVSVGFDMQRFREWEKHNSE